MSVTINGTGNTITPVTVNTTGSVNGITPQASNMQPFNRIINGDMRIDQRNAGASSSTGAGFLGYVTVDRWAIGANENIGTIQQVSDAPVGFVQSTKITVTGTTAANPTDYATFCQRVEGNNIADFGWGTSSAKTATISFWVKASISGTYAGYVYNNSYSYCFPFSYSVNSTNTWEYKTITIIAPTTGSFPTGTSYGVEVGFTLYAGSSYRGTANTWNATNYAIAPTSSITYPFQNNGMTIQWTGVQLEAGSAASPFAHENYGDTLQKCQRYYQRIQAASDTYKHFGLHFCSTDSGATAYGTAAIPLVTTMRAIPTLVTTGTVSNYSVVAKNTNFTCTNISIDTGIDDGTISGNLYINAYTSTGNTAGAAGALRANNTASAFIAMDAEL